MHVCLQLSIRWSAKEPSSMPSTSRLETSERYWARVPPAAHLVLQACLSWHKLLHPSPSPLVLILLVCQTCSECHHSKPVVVTKHASYCRANTQASTAC